MVFEVQMWEVKLKLGIFRQKPSFLSRGTSLSRANIAQEIECGFATVTGIALSYEALRVSLGSTLSQILGVIENC